MSSAPKIVIAAGGTAGHVVPALAVADALRAEGAAVTFIGGDRAEAELVPAAGYELRRIAVEGISRTNPLLAARALGRAGAAFFRARTLLRQLGPDAVMGGGGYVAGPVGLAAVTLRIPLVLSEADSHLGLTNRVLARAARRVCLAFPLAGREAPRYRVTGRPGPPPREDRLAARARLGLAEGAECVLVFGGSLGARSINLAAIEAFAGGETSSGGEPVGGPSPGRLSSGTTSSAGGEISPGGASVGGPSRGRLSSGTTSCVGELPRGAGSTGAAFTVLHVAGRRDYPELAARAASSERYELREYLELDDFGDALAVADLVVARAGGSVFEIAASGTPAILVPYPHASADHQAANARWMADAGAAVVIADRDLSGRVLAAEVTALLADRARLIEMAAASKRLARPNAAGEIAEELLQAAA